MGVVVLSGSRMKWGWLWMEELKVENEREGNETGTSKGGPGSRPLPADQHHTSHPPPPSDLLSIHSFIFIVTCYPSAPHASLACYRLNSSLTGLLPS